MFFGYNTLVYRVYFSVMLLVVLMCSGCNTGPADQAPTPDFVTAVLPYTPILVLTPTITSTMSVPAENETATPTPSLIEGVTTTQVNVRSEPSTAGETLGMIGIFAKVQIIAKDASGSWYQIVYAESQNGSGWIRAEYVQVDAAAQIQVIEAGAGSGSAVSGLVLQKINVRQGPASSFDSLGV